MKYNNLNDLYENLINELKDNNLENSLFGDERIVIVPNHNVARMLKINLASKNDVVTRITFLTEDEFINKFIKPFNKIYKGFSKGYLKYYILNILKLNIISPNISNYYKNNDLRKFNYANELEKSFIHYQKNANYILKDFNKFDKPNKIDNIFDLELYIYKSLKATNFLPLNEVIDLVEDNNLKIYYIKTNNESELFNNLISKFNNVFKYELELINNNKKLILLNNWSKIREMETIFDNITELIETKNYLPSDILVLVPNINDYTSAINYVFSKKVGNFNQYKYSIYNNSNNNDIFSEFLSKLNIELDYRFEASSLFELFELSLNIKNYKKNKAELDLVKDWISNNAIRSGIVSFENDDYTFENGFSKLVRGLMLKADTFDFSDTYVSKNISLNEYELFEMFYNFIMMINKLNKYECMNLKELNNLFIEAFEIFIGSEYKEGSIQSKIYQTWFDLVNNKFNLLNYVPSVKMAFKMLEDEINKISYKDSFNGGINFGSFNDFLFVNSKYLILAGLDDNSFPNKANETTLNLDEQINEKTILKQKNLFETFVYANNEVLLSYVGMNETNRKDINRSIFIDTILNGNVREVKHKLHPFDKIYFSNENKDYFTYDLRYKIKDKLKVKSPFNYDVILNETNYKSLNELIYIFKYPVQNWFLNNLKVTYPSEVENIKNSPTFYIQNEDKLEEALVKRAIFNDHLNNSNIELKKAKAKGIVPFRKYGDILVDNFMEEVKKFNIDLLDESKYQLIKNIKLKVENFDINIENLIYDIKNDEYLLFDISKITDTKDNFRLNKIFSNYLFQSIAIKYNFNKALNLVGLNQNDEIVYYNKDPKDILLLENDNLSLLVESLKIFWELKNQLETNLYLFDLSIVDAMKKFENLDIHLKDNGINDENIINFVINSNNIDNVLINNKFDEKFKKELLEIIESYFNKFLFNFDRNGFGLMHYDKYYEYLLSDNLRASDYIKTYGSKSLIESIKFINNIKILLDI